MSANQDYEFHNPKHKESDFFEQGRSRADKLQICKEAAAFMAIALFIVFLIQMF